MEITQTAHENTIIQTVQTAHENTIIQTAHENSIDLQMPPTWHRLNKVYRLNSTIRCTDQTPPTWHFLNKVYRAV